MNNVTLSSLGNLTLCNDIVTDIDVESIIGQAGLSNYVDKRLSNSLSGDVVVWHNDLSVVDGDMKVYGGNYVQATDAENVYNYS